MGSPARISKAGNAGLGVPYPPQQNRPVEAPDSLITGRIVRPGVVRVTGKAAEGFRLLQGETPLQHYPAAAKQAGIEGKVLVDLLLNDMGQVLEAQVISESPRGHGFALAALDTAKTYEFANPLKKPVLMSVTVEFTRGS